ncbi:MAG: hypothetical protein IPJ38_17060 [Dechloromonas sp.]|uniref:Uncharacterized protein n=1 Tax=Candidatus Dechloromonas phosphorivorans TaxID=2899244 RepID=A0A935N289_9RHOO|nr:hypothetical protein [Candidatus Dechloromonas phosphorivorans]
MAGGHCLIQLAAVFTHNARRTGDLALRYGGVEFRGLPG